jgi:putative methyltransferase (TIGR04325 family)
MGMRLKDMLRLVTPPVFIHLAKRLRGNLPTAVYGLSGDYRSWDEAMAASTGYDSDIILEKTRVALMKIKHGEAAYERDSVLFDEIQYAWPLLTGLMWTAAHCGGTLNVLDFGGSLGSTYFQNRIFLSALPQVRWNIVEQSRHVETGRTWFEDDHLRFYMDIADCLADTQPNVVVLSGVLQYLEHPYAIFESILRLPCDCVIIDRTPFWAGPKDRLCVQTVPPDIYPASYPSWIFSKDRFFSKLKEGWKIMTTFDNIDRLNGPIDFSYQGALLDHNTNLS